MAFNLATILREAARSHPDKAALIVGDPSLAGVDRRQDAEAVLQCRRGIEAEILAVPGADHLHRLRETVGDADRERHSRKSECIDGHRHAHGPEVFGNPTFVQVGARFAGYVRGDRGDDQRVVLGELAPRSQE